MFHDNDLFGDNFLFEKSQPKNGYVFPTWNTSSFVQSKIPSPVMFSHKKRNGKWHFSGARGLVHQSLHSYIHTGVRTLGIYGG